MYDDLGRVVQAIKLKVRARVIAHEALVQLADRPLDLVVDEVQSGVPSWKLAVNESFIFFAGRSGWGGVRSWLAP